LANQERFGRIRNAVLIGTAIVVIGGSLWLLPPDKVNTQNFLHHLNIIPTLFAGLLFGWRAAVAATLFAAMVESPYMWASTKYTPYGGIDLLVELCMYGVAGSVAGILADRGKRQNAALQKSGAELSRVYQELNQNLEKLKQAERLHAAGRLSASLAHEIRNPLESISGAASLLNRGTERDERFFDCLEIIDKESQRLNRLLAHFLQFASPRALRLQRADLREIIQSSAALLAHQPRKGVEIRTEIQSPLAEIECDPEKLKQVLLNLIVNAIQATPDSGNVTISAGSTTKAVLIEVRDEGIGLSPEQLNHIFDPFYTTKENGTGLGLAISANIVAQHGGHLTAAQNSDKGSTFRIELPKQGMEK
jgi:signal transduction histidine kinase